MDVTNIFVTGFIALLAVGAILLVVFAVLSIARHPTATSTEKVVWILVVLCFTVVGPIVWFTVGRNIAGRHG